MIFNHEYKYKCTTMSYVLNNDAIMDKLKVLNELLFSGINLK